LLATVLNILIIEKRFKNYCTFLFECKRNAMKFDIVIARYNENIEWLELLNHDLIRNIFVYNKGEECNLINVKVISRRLENIGREAHTYLTYCVEMYNNLPDFVIFLQGNPHGITINNINDWIDSISKSFVHCTENNKIGNLDWFLRDGKLYEWGGPIDNSSFNIWEWSKTYVRESIPKENINIFWHACFGVSEKAIRSNPIVKYQTIIEKELNRKNSEAAHFLERTWYYLFNLDRLNMNLSKNIWLYWGQGWHNAPNLQKYVASSWYLNNPNWKLNLLDDEKIYDLLRDEVPYLFDKNKNITYQAKSDIIRLAILNKYGGVWADSTLLCMQPLDPWVFEAVEDSGVWMYHSWGGGLPANLGISSWFIVSKEQSYIIKEWKKECDNYWGNRIEAHTYFWMDQLFRRLFDNDKEFNHQWGITPNICSEDYGQAHCMSQGDGMGNCSRELKLFFKNSPPYVLKYWSHWNNFCENIKDEQCRNSISYFALLMAKRRFSYKHSFKKL